MLDAAEKELKGSVTMSTAVTVERESLTTLKEKFMQLLEADRNSPEFIHLFEEIDAQLELHLEGVDEENVA